MTLQGSLSNVTLHHKLRQPERSYREVSLSDLEYRLTFLKHRPSRPAHHLEVRGLRVRSL